MIVPVNLSWITTILFVTTDPATMVRWRQGLSLHDIDVHGWCSLFETLVAH